MKKILATILLTLFVCGESRGYDDTNSTILVNQSKWLPTHKQTELALMKVYEYLLNFHEKDEYRQRRVDKVVKQFYTKYAVQFVGVVVDPNTKNVATEIVSTTVERVTKQKMAAAIVSETSKTIEKLSK